jgi:hypothetical protein
LEEYLKNLVPKIPEAFQDTLTGRGAFYTLQLPQDKLSSSITVSKSLYIPNGLFLAVEFAFNSFESGLMSAYKISKDRFEYIFTSLNLNVKTEL